MPESHSIRSRVAVIAALAFVVAGSVASAATDPARVCAAAKQKAAFKLMNSLGKCLVKAVKNGTPLDTECITKASTKFDDSFDKAEDKGGCVTTSDAGQVETVVNNCALSIVSKLPFTTTTMPQYTCGGVAPSCGGTCPPGFTCDGGMGGPGASCDCNP
jgi:hypothetical protein